MLETLADMRRDPKQINDDYLMDHYIAGEYNKADFQSLRTELAERKTPQGQALTADRDLFMKRVGQMVNPEQDPTKSGNQYLFEMAARAKEADLKSKGIDPREAYDPASPNYFGKEENINKYKVPYTQQMQNIQQERRIPVPLRGIGALDHNKDWTRFRDSSTGKIYDEKGQEIKVQSAPAPPTVPLR
jgi:hypothetical protein